MERGGPAEVVDGAAAASCAGFDVLIARLGTEALGADDAQRVKAHLAGCERCAELSRLFEGEGDAEMEEAGAALPIVAGATIAGRYRLDRLLGRGGMGVVWAAVQSRTGQPVAIKLLDERSGEPRARRRFLREARAVCAVRHPNVVRVYDVVDLPDGAPAIVMELLAGHSLQRRFDRGAMALGDLCHVLARVAAGVGAAHAAGIIHRDLKPENVFLARAPGGAVEVKVLDFGVAKRSALAPDLGSGTLTRTGALVGTPYYMSPEQALGEDDLDARSDVWALGILLYQGLSSVLPTRGDNLGQVIKAVAMTPIEPIERLVPGLPSDLVELLARMLNKEREGRPDDMEEVRDLLERHASVRVEALPELDAAERALDAISTMDAAAPSSRPVPAPPPVARPKRALAAVVSVSLILAGAGAAAVLFGHGPPSSETAATPELSVRAAASHAEPPSPTASAAPSLSLAPPPMPALSGLRPPLPGDARVKASRVSPPPASASPPVSAPSSSAAAIGIERAF